LAFFSHFVVPDGEVHIWLH